eukprot:15415878-Alexandrium_andersonii.AAC.1
MSASLVGSEMCIRDSPGEERDTLQRPTDVRGLSARAALPRLAAARGPVSYTHLTLPTICSV